MSSSVGKKGRTLAVVLAIVAVVVIALAYTAWRMKLQLVVRQYPAEDVIVELEDPVLPQRGPQSDLARFAVGSLVKLDAPAYAPPTPDYVFKAPDGADARLSDFRGKVVVVNVWAMWCVPCRTEMPTLAALAKSYEGRDVAVVTVNVDNEATNVAAAGPFLEANAPLPFYRDPKFQLPFELPGKGGMPQTVLLDRQGRVRAHLTGGADWSSPEAKAVIDALLADPDRS